MNAHMLPAGSIVASATRVWIKRSNERTQPKGSPFYETWWSEARTFDVPAQDREIQALINEGSVTVLREGNGL